MILHRCLAWNERAAPDAADGALWFPRPYQGEGRHDNPAAYGCLSSAFSDALAAALHTNNLNITVPGATNNGTTLTTSRVYHNVNDIQKEIVNARVWAGLHYRGSALEGLKLARDVARWTLRRYFQPTP